MSKYLRFRELPNPGRKTKIIVVNSSRSGERLAAIQWYGPWRQYTLWPEPDTIWNDGCLRDVLEYMNGLKEERARRAERDVELA